MAVGKEKLIKDIISTRRKVNVKSGMDVREIELFEEQYEKSLRRVEQEKYLAKKFNQDELEKTLKAYEALMQG
ncbi:MAG: hypothetical protein E7231_07505 [Cellulosilyticum sp.]|nr:hypothetical protein [Cellulosilyticum sp.]